MEHQSLAASLRIAPRAGFAWTPFADARTVFRAGWGQFYDHIPLDVYTFGRYPERTVTYYAPDGSVIGEPIDYVNVIGSVTGPRSFLVRGTQVTGGFAPRGGTYNGQIEHRFSRLLHVRATYTDNRSVGLITFEPDLLGTHARNRAERRRSSTLPAVRNHGETHLARRRAIGFLVHAQPRRRNL